MKNNFLILLITVISLFAEQLPTKSAVTVSDFGSLILESGIANLTENDSGSSILFESGKLWIKGREEKIQIFCSEGIISVSGTALFESDLTALRIRVIKGFVRIVETGGFPGEIVPSGYERTLYKNGGNAPRRLIVEDLRRQLCDSFPGTVALGCPALVDTSIKKSIPRADSVLAKPIIRIHPVTQGDSIQNAAISSIPKMVMEKVVTRQPTAQITAINSIDYRKPSESSGDSDQHYIIVDCTIPKRNLRNPKHEVIITFFDSRLQRTTSFVHTLKHHSKSADSAEEISEQIISYLISFLENQ